MPATPIQLTDAERMDLAVQKAACPFIGSAIVEKKLQVRNTLDTPLASIEDVKALGNVAGGNLGVVLAMFATGNHTRMRDASGAFNNPIESPDLFSLDFPGSQGSHAGDSGILLGDAPRSPPFEFHAGNFDRLASFTKDERIDRRQVGEFIAQNVRRDPGVGPLGLNLVFKLLQDVSGMLGALVPDSTPVPVGQGPQVLPSHRRAIERLTHMLGAHPMIASAGEFGLLFALISTESDPPSDRGPTISLEDTRAMFKDKRLPKGWNTEPKSCISWVNHTLAIVTCAHES